MIDIDPRRDTFVNRTDWNTGNWKTQGNIEYTLQKHVPTKIKTRPPFYASCKKQPNERACTSKVVVRHLALQMLRNPRKILDEGEPQLVPARFDQRLPTLLAQPVVKHHHRIFVPVSDNHNVLMACYQNTE